MHNEYVASSVERKWQKKWDDAKIYAFDLKKAKDPFYMTVMFPYPSGAQLHVGHWFQYSIPDSIGRYMRMKRKDVFFPMGFDAFGLPAENYAIKTGVPPAESTEKNVEAMIGQFKRMGTMFDWKYSLNTSRPEYYRWTQWLFLQMFKNELAYRKEANVNWCPKDQTVLANEQVKEGLCERCGTEVVQKSLTQWFWKTTKYADKLIDNLDDLDWPEKTKLMQKNWIGRSEGAEIRFDIEGSKEKIEVFTTRPDTLFGVTYVVLAPEHPLVEKITPKSHWGTISAFKDQVKSKTELQRTDLNDIKMGEPLGAFALHPVTGEKIPIWIADYVLMNYGTGAVMAVPSHDERDYDFSGPHQLPLKCVIKPEKNIANFSSEVHPSFAVAIRDSTSLDEALKFRDESDYQSILNNEKCWTGPGTLINSKFLDGLDVDDAKKKMIAWLEDSEKGRGVVNFRLRDWLVSRQRYWGAPIPVVYDPQGNPHPVPEKHLPWLLPTDVEFKPTGKSPLVDSKEFIERTEKIFGKGWVPEFDTMDTFVCSSFYYLRYLAEGNEKHLVDPTIEKNWMPVDMYIGGPEHANMHLIYARFVMMALKDAGFVHHEEPFKRLVHQGLITNQGAKMSKSKGNVVSPDSFVEFYGSDVFRMYLMFMGPFTDGGDWSDSGIKGTARFVQRLWKYLPTAAKKKHDDGRAVLMQLHKTIKAVTEGLEKLHFNTAISSLMELLNELEKHEAVSIETAQTIARLIAPIAPHLADELFEALGGKGFVIDQEWPVHDPKLLVSDTMTIVIQINGKVRGDIQVSSNASKEDIIAEAKKTENAQKYLDGATIKKQIYVPGKLVSFVI
jgi:leucyl-tRNA synthetase